MAQVSLLKSQQVCLVALFLHIKMVGSSIHAIFGLDKSGSPAEILYSTYIQKAVHNVVRHVLTSSFIMLKLSVL